jgi:hypothetical protein
MNESLTKNYARARKDVRTSFPDWMKRAFQSETVSTETKARTSEYLRENHRHMSMENAEEILRNIIEKPESEPLPEFYYDSDKTSFWTTHDRGNWMTINASDVKRRLREMGYNSRTSADQESQ